MVIDQAPRAICTHSLYFVSVVNPEKLHWQKSPGQAASSHSISPIWRLTASAVLRKKGQRRLRQHPTVQNLLLTRKHLWHLHLLNSVFNNCDKCWQCLWWDKKPKMATSLQFTGNTLISKMSFPPTDNFRATTIVWRIRGKIVGQFCSVLRTAIVPNYMYTCISSSYRCLSLKWSVMCRVGH